MLIYQKIRKEATSWYLGTHSSHSCFLVALHTLLYMILSLIAQGAPLMLTYLLASDLPTFSLQLFQLSGRAAPWPWCLSYLTVCSHTVFSRKWASLFGCLFLLGGITFKEEFSFLYMCLLGNLLGAGLITDTQKEMSMEWMNGWLCANEWISVDWTAHTSTS